MRSSAFACSMCIIIMCDAFWDKVNHHFCILWYEMCRFLNIIILLNMTLTLMKGEMRINPHVSDLRQEQLKQHLEHNNTYGWPISHFLLPWSTIALASTVEPLHVKLKPCLKTSTSSFFKILFEGFKESLNLSKIPGSLPSPVEQMPPDVSECVVFLLPSFFPHWWPAGVLPASSCSPQTPLCLSWVSLTCQAGCRAERLVNRWRDGTVDFISLCP